MRGLVERRGRKKLGWLLGAFSGFWLLAMPALAADVGAERQVGRASWYGARHHKERTATGERYNRSALTAAHPTLPMNSRVRVTNLENGRSVVVRINDRGPYNEGRIIDLSQRAAEMLGMKRRGVATVRIDPVAD